MRQLVSPKLTRNDQFRIGSPDWREPVVLQVVIECADLDARGITGASLGHLRDGLTGQVNV